MTLSRYDVARSHGTKLDPLRSYSVRVPASLWQRMGWAAAEQQISRSKFIRATFERASRDAKPPETSESLSISVDKDRAARLVKLEAHCRKPDEPAMPLGEFAGKVLDWVYKRKFPDAIEVPEVVNE